MVHLGLGRRRESAAADAEEPIGNERLRVEWETYARVRMGLPYRVRFGLTIGASWDDVLQLDPRWPRPGERAARRTAACEAWLEHLLAHALYFPRELALLLHAWTYPEQLVPLPFASEQLPGAVVARLVGQAWPELREAGQPWLDLPFGRCPRYKRQAIVSLVDLLAAGRDERRLLRDTPGAVQRLAVLDDLQPRWQAAAARRHGRGLQPWTQVTTAILAQALPADLVPAALPHPSPRGRAAEAWERIQPLVESAAAEPAAGEARRDSAAAVRRDGPRLLSAALEIMAELDRHGLVPRWPRTRHLRVVRAVGGWTRATALAALARAEVAAAQRRRGVVIAGPWAGARSEGQGPDETAYAPGAAPDSAELRATNDSGVEARASGPEDPNDLPATEPGALLAHGGSLRQDDAASRAPRTRPPRPRRWRLPLGGIWRWLGRIGSVRSAAATGLRQTLGREHVRGAGRGRPGRLHPRASASDRVAYRRDLRTVAPHVRALVTRVAQARAQTAHTQRFTLSGRLDRHRLVAAMRGDARVYYRRRRAPRPDLAVLVAVDLSASVGARAPDLQRAAILLQAALARLGLAHEVHTFGAHLGCYKRFEGADAAALGGLARRFGGATPLADAIAQATARLKIRPEQRRGLVVLTDGASANRRGVADAVARARRAGIRPLGLVLRGESVADLFGPDWAAVTNLHQLGVAASRWLSRWAAR